MNAIAIDSAGNAFITGEADNLDPSAICKTYKNFPSTGFTSGVYVGKINPSGSALVYSSCFGGSYGSDIGYGIAVDSSDNAYIYGITPNADFPVTKGAFQSGTPGTLYEGAFITKVNAAGNGFVYSAMLGTCVAGWTGGYPSHSIALDSNNDVAVAGTTCSTTFPVTSGAYQSQPSNTSEVAFVSKLNPTGSALLYSTYLGGKSSDVATASTMDASGNIYVTGYTESADFPTTSGAFQLQKTGIENGFITKFAVGNISNPTAATPTFSPVAGTYATTQAVVISDTTPNATIYYTTDGTTPTTSSSQYIGTIPVSDNTTIQAIATASGYSQSAVASAAYSIMAATPTFSPAAGTYTSAQTVTINDSTTGAAVYYTTDGSTPTTSSTKYSGTIKVNSTETIQAIAVSNGYANSGVATATYTINITTPTVATPTFSPAAGSYTSAQTVTISDTTSGATIYYTTNGTTPTTSSTKYTTPISVSASETIQAIAVAAGDTNSAVASAAYIINTTPPTAATPTFSPIAGTYTSAQTVTISDTTGSATIYYTTNGTTPTTSSTKYTGAITVSSTETIKALAVATGYTNSAVASASYTINTTTPTAATPTFSPTAGTYTSAQTVTILDTTTGATVYYTTNGTTPTTSSTKYTGAITVSSTETIEAIAVATGYNNSTVASALFTIIVTTPTAATPAFSPAGGTYTSAQTVTITNTTTGAIIYYTTDGSTPTTSAAKYTSAITVSTSTTINAIAVAAGYTNSVVASATYTINTATPNFAVGVSASSLTVSAGSSGTETVTVTPQNGFKQAVALTCAGLPTGATCSFTPASVTPSGAAVTAQLTVAVASGTAKNNSPSLPWYGTGGIAFALCCFAGIRRLKNYRRLFLFVGVLGLCVAAIGCGGSSGSSGSPSKGSTTTVTVNGTSGSLQQSATFTLIIP